MKTLFLAASLLVSSACAGVLLSVNFDHDSLGSYSQAQAQSDFEKVTTSGQWLYGFEQGRAAIVAADSGHGHALRLTYPKGCVGPNDPTACAAQARVVLSEGSHDTLWLQYRILFEPDFQFVKGGKLPGLCGSQCNTGGHIPKGDDGWSARNMWRAEGKVVQYLYYAGQPGTYGVDVSYDYNKNKPALEFLREVWHTITEQVLLNTPGKANGRVRSWYDGQLAADSSGYMFRTQDSMHINQFYLSTFFGGNDASWAPTADVHTQMDDIVISTDPLLDTSVVAAVQVSTAPHLSASDAIFGAQIVENKLQLAGSTLDTIDVRILSNLGRVLLQTQMLPHQVSLQIPAGSAAHMIRLQAGDVSRSIPLGK